MKSNRNIVYFLRNFNKKHRLSMRKQHDDVEVWYMHTSPVEALGGIVAVVLILFVITLSLVAYTPILELIPGYGNQPREIMIENIMRVDSMERRLNELQVYTNDVSRILEGRSPVGKSQPAATDSVAQRIDIVLPNAADSILRAQMEGSGVYGLSHVAFGRTSLRSGMDLTSPVRGVVATHFNPKEDRYGTGIATAVDQQILAVGQGTIVLSTWSPGSGYTIQVQHPGNLISIYKNCSRAIHAVGTRVRDGEIIGYTGEGISGEGGKNLFEIELWQNGTPVDPESYILF